jgi:hypothetical protein
LRLNLEEKVDELIDRNLNNIPHADIASIKINEEKLTEVIAGLNNFIQI